MLVLACIDLFLWPAAVPQRQGALEISTLDPTNFFSFTQAHFPLPFT
jgi:hypothetical protein